MTPLIAGKSDGAGCFRLDQRFDVGVVERYETVALVVASWLSRAPSAEHVRFQVSPSRRSCTSGVGKPSAKASEAVHSYIRSELDHVGRLSVRCFGKRTACESSQKKKPALYQRRPSSRRSMTERVRSLPDRNRCDGSRRVGSVPAPLRSCCPRSVRLRRYRSPGNGRRD